MSSPEPSYGTKQTNKKKTNTSKNSKYFHPMLLRILKMHQCVSVLHKLIPWMNGESLILSTNSQEVLIQKARFLPMIKRLLPMNFDGVALM